MYIEAGYSYAATVIAIGTDALPITFTKNTGAQNWGYSSGGIVLWDKTTTQTVFDHCIVEYATSGFDITSLPAVITNCKIRNNAKSGIDFNNKAMPKDSASFIKDSITDNGAYPISIIAEGLTKLSGDTYIKGNTPDGIEVTGGNVTQSGTWKKHGVPYVFTDYANLGAATGVTITINPGVKCRFDAEAYINVGYSYSATLIANGTAQDSIKFTNTLPGAPWGSTGTNGGGFMFWDKTTTNTSLKYCIIDSATGGMYVGTTKITVSNCSIRDNSGSGIFFSANGTPKDSASFVDNRITGNADYAIEIYASNLGSLSGTGSVAGNTKGGIYVTGDKVDADAIWKKHDAPYIVEGEVRIESATGSTVTIRPGTRFELLQEAFFSIGYAQTGSIIANGTATDSIIFTGHTAGAPWGGTNTDGAGFEMWTGTAATTSLTYCLIEKATAGVFVDTKANVTIKNCTIRDNSGFGIGYFNSTIPITNISSNTYGTTGSNPDGDLVNLNP
jgi:hypothetical protein